MLFSRCDDEEETHLLTRQGIINPTLTFFTPCGSAFPHRSGLSTGTKEKWQKTNPAEEKKTFRWLQEIFRHYSCSHEVMILLMMRIVLEVSTVPSHDVQQRLSGQKCWLLSFFISVMQKLWEPVGVFLFMWLWRTTKLAILIYSCIFLKCFVC